MTIPRQAWAQELARRASLFAETGLAKRHSPADNSRGELTGFRYRQTPQPEATREDRRLSSGGLCSMLPLGVRAALDDIPVTSSRA